MRRKTGGEPEPREGPRGSGWDRSGVGLAPVLLGGHGLVEADGGVAPDFRG